MTVVLGLNALAALLPLPGDVPLLAVKLALTFALLGVLFACLMRLANPYKEPWRWYLRVALVVLSASCVVVNGATRALDLGHGGAALEAFVTPASYVNVALFFVAVVVLLVGFGYNLLSKALSAPEAQAGTPASDSVIDASSSGSKEPGIALSPSVPAAEFTEPAAALSEQPRGALRLGILGRLVPQSRRSIEPPSAHREPPSGDRVPPTAPPGRPAKPAEPAPAPPSPVPPNPPAVGAPRAIRGWATAESARTQATPGEVSLNWDAASGARGATPGPRLAHPQGTAPLFGGAALRPAPASGLKHWSESVSKRLPLFSFGRVDAPGAVSSETSQRGAALGGPVLALQAGFGRADGAPLGGRRASLEAWGPAIRGESGAAPVVPPAELRPAPRRRGSAADALSLQQAQLQQQPIHAGFVRRRSWLASAAAAEVLTPASGTGVREDAASPVAPRPGPRALAYQAAPAQGLDPRPAAAITAAASAAAAPRLPFGRWARASQTDAADAAAAAASGAANPAQPEAVLHRRRSSAAVTAAALASGVAVAASPELRTEASGRTLHDAGKLLVLV